MGVNIAALRNRVCVCYSICLWCTEDEADEEEEAEKKNMLLLQLHSRTCAQHSTVLFTQICNISAERRHVFDIQVNGNIMRIRAAAASGYIDISPHKKPHSLLSR